MVELTESNGFLMTWNPQKWFDPEWVEESVLRSLEGRRMTGTRWSSAGRKHGYKLDDRVFLLKQGAEPRGIVASGWISSDSGTYQGSHWDGSGRLTPYIDVDWEYMVDPEFPLSLDLLRHAAPSTGWRPQSSGSRIDPADLPAVEALWAQHIGMPPAGSASKPAMKRQLPVRTGWQQDPYLRKLVEDYAQEALELKYRQAGWVVKDTRTTCPYDARASKGRNVRYLEAKGTIGEGSSVLVTAGEVRFARDHPGECVMGIVCEIELTPDRQVKPGSGQLTEFNWDPDRGSLEPTAFRWTPSI